MTNCAYGSVTTETISLYTTYCPVKPTPAAYTTAVETEYPYTTKTVYYTTTYTISKCAAYVSNCPYGSKTTEVIAHTTAYPVSTVSTVYSTTTYTISKCAPMVTNCPYGSKTTEIYAAYTTVVPCEYTPVTTVEAYTEVSAVVYSPYPSVVTSVVAVVVTPVPYSKTVVASIPGYAHSTGAAVLKPSVSHTIASPALYTGGAGKMAKNVAVVVGAVGAAVAML